MTDEIQAARDKSLGTVPAHDEEAEAAVLGSIFLGPEVLDLVAASLRPEHFYRAAHGRLFAFLEELRAKKTPIDELTVCSHLRDAGLLDALGGSATISRFSSAVPTSANAEYYAERVLSTARLREARRVVSQALTFLCESRDPPDEQLAVVQSKVFAATAALERRSSRPLTDLFAEAFTRLEARREGRLQGVLSGYPVLDGMTRGFQPGEVTVLAARPSVGKSAFALNVARNVVREGVPVAVFSIEMEGVSLAENLLGSIAQVNTLEIRRATLSRSQHEAVLDAGQKTEAWPLTIDDERPCGMRVLRSKALRLRAQKKLGLLVVDYLQMMEADVRGRNRAEEIAEISRGLKVLARELAVPIVALAALNRDSERETKPRRPRMSDLRESGSIEFDADTILLLHPMYYSRSAENRIDDDAVTARAEDEATAKKNGTTNAVDLIVAKARLGETGVARFFFNKATCTFAPVAYGRDREWTE